MSADTPKRCRLRLDPERYRALKMKILERDGWKCQYCGRRDQLQIHHKIRRSQLGLDTPDPPGDRGSGFAKVPNGYCQTCRSEPRTPGQRILSIKSALMWPVIMPTMEVPANCLGSQTEKRTAPGQLPESFLRAVETSGKQDFRGSIDWLLTGKPQSWTHLSRANHLG